MWCHYKKAVLYRDTDTHRMMFSYSLSAPLESFQRRYMTEASTLAGEKVLGSFNSEMTLSKMVLQQMENNLTMKLAFQRLIKMTSFVHLSQVKSPAL